MKVLRIAAKCLLALLLFALALVFGTSISPIYDFAEGRAFSGPDIFNPYSSVDSTVDWARANFHTHTKVKGLLNECDYWPETVLEDYRKLGYDIVTFSNHNELTVHPCDSTLQVNVYEHGYGLFKYHKLVFGADRVRHFDHIFPFLASQRQWQMDYLGKDADFIQLNHPYRTSCTSQDIMEKLTGYRIVELDSGSGTEQEYWDWALSSGHYSFALANDDNHDSKTSSKIAVRASFLDTESAEYSDIKDVLLSGAYYCMRIPDYGNGDWNVKYEKNRQLPEIDNIDIVSDTLCISLTKPAREIRITGQDHKTLASFTDTCDAKYLFRDSDSYARFTAYFDDGAVIYTNAFARYDSKKTPTPYVESEHKVNVPLTVLFNLLLAILFTGCVIGEYKLFSHKKSEA